MKKVAFLFFGVMVFSIVLAGCGRKEQGNDNDTEDIVNTEDGSFSSQIEEPAMDSEDTSQLQLGNAVEIPEGFKGELAEEEAHGELEQVIAEYCNVAKEDYENVRYYYNYVDLNGDGKDEILALALGQEVSGIDGNVLLWVEAQGEHVSKDSVRQAFAQVGVPVYISYHMTEGYRDLIITQNPDTVAVLAETGGESEINPISLVQTYRLLAWTGEQYQSLEDGTVLEDIRSLEGTAILTNNIESDFANDNYHFLGEAMK